jgi:hypothetical protein
MTIYMPIVVQMVLIVLKLAGVLTLSWLAVTAFTWFPLVVFAALVLFALVISLIVD